MTVCRYCGRLVEGGGLHLSAVIFEEVKLGGGAANCMGPGEGTGVGVIQENTIQDF